MGMVLRQRVWAGGVGSLLAVLVSGCTGCSSGATDRPEVYPVEGTVMYKSQPVEGAIVAFSAEGQPRPAQGITDAEGKFRLSTFGANDGAVAGEHTVVITKTAPDPANSSAAANPTAAMNDPQAMTQMMRDRGQPTEPEGPKHLIPEKYSSLKTTPIKETVTKEGPNTFVFQLTD